jgi:hypothetical protein
VEFKNILHVKKVAKRYRAEQLFKIMLIKEMKGPMPNGPGDKTLLGK